MPHLHPTIISSIESPAPGPVRAAGVVLRGWALSKEGDVLSGIRLRLPDGGTLDGLYGLPRPDVAAAFPQAPLNTGWELRTLLPAGQHTILLEVRTAEGAWVTAKEFTLEMRPAPFPRWSRWAETLDLLMFQFPVHAAYQPRPLRPERFPRQALKSAQLPKLSIVTPSFQQAWALGRCMDSVLTQRDRTKGKRQEEPGSEGGYESQTTVPPDSHHTSGIEIDYVVQDGGSTDGSDTLIRARAAHLAAWEHAPDGGQAKAIIRGFAKTSGHSTDLMAWINSDDFYLPGTLRFVADYFARHPDVDVVYGHRIVVDRSGHEIARWFLPKHDPEVLRLNDFVPQETLFWRRRIWDKVGGLDPSFHFAMDWDLLLRFQEAKAKIVRLPYFLACFTAHPEQKTTAQLDTRGKAEIDLLLRRTFGRDVATPDELFAAKCMQRYLRKSAWIEQLWKWGIRAR